MKNTSKYSDGESYSDKAYKTSKYVETIMKQTARLADVSSEMTAISQTYYDTLQSLEESIVSHSKINNYSSLGNAMVKAANTLEKLADESNTLIAVLEHNEDIDEADIDAMLSIPISDMNKSIRELRSMGEKLASFGDETATSLMGEILDYTRIYESVSTSVSDTWK